jgi:drug/metabolite transporter (DMT)-like permease
MSTAPAKGLGGFSAGSGAGAGRIDTTATAACLGALLFWSLGPIFVKYLSGHVDAWTQNALRYSVACLFWLPSLAYFAARGNFAGRTWRRAILPSFANLVMQSLWAAGFYYLDPAFMTLLTKTSVFWVAGFSLLFFRDERPLARSGRFWLGLLLSVLGMLGVLYFKEDFTAKGTLLGIAIALGEAFMWGVYTLAVRVAFRDTDSRSSFAVMCIYAALGMWICALLLGEPAQALALDMRAWAVVVISAVTSIALAHVFYYAAIRRIGATIPMLVVLAQPFVVFSLSSVIYHERLTGLQLLSGAVLLLGSALSVWAQQHLRPEPAGPVAQPESP